MITQWENALLRSIRLDESTENGLTSEAEKLCDRLEKTFYKHFPKSWCRFTFKKMVIGSDWAIYGSWTLGKDKTEYASGYFDNDPMYSQLFIEGFNTDGSLVSDLVEVDLFRGGHFSIKARNPMYAFESIKVWRKFPQTTPEKTVAKFDAYFNKLHDEMVKVKDEIPVGHLGKEMYSIEDKL